VRDSVVERTWAIPSWSLPERFRREAFLRDSVAKPA
jgi:hypothetical protein